MIEKPKSAKNWSPASQRGVALVLVMICMLILLTIATLMILSAGVESYLNANYRSSTKAYYAAMNGLEEGRGRLTPGGTDVLVSNAIKAGGTNPIPLGQVVYIVNPVSGQTVNPTDLSTGNLYADNEYTQEFGTPVTAAPGLQPLIISTSPALAAGLPGPIYQWVRINPVTKRSLKVDVDGTGITTNQDTPLYYDGTSLNLNSTGQQVLEVTALSVLPDGTRKMLQYQVQPPPFNLSFASATTLDGSVGNFSPPSDSDSAFQINGNDQTGGGLACSPIEPMKPSVGITSSLAMTTVNGHIAGTGWGDHYIGLNGVPSSKIPSVGDVSGFLSPYFQSVAGMEGGAGQKGLVATLAPLLTYPPVTGNPVTGLPDYGTVASPVTAMVQGDLTITNAFNGYGLLLVRGNVDVTGSGSFTWKGIVLVIGKGSLTVESGGGVEIDGALLLAKTLDYGGNPLGSLGTVNVNWYGGYGNGVFYNSCWIAKAQPTSSYSVLSFREIPNQ